MIGDRIKQARIALGYSAEQVAAFLDVSPATVYRYENGKWHLHGENLLPYFKAVFYERNGYYLYGMGPTLTFDGYGKLYLSMRAKSAGKGTNNGPLVMKYVADNWDVHDN